jgi:hypothetical protein
MPESLDEPVGHVDNDLIVTVWWDSPGQRLRVVVGDVDVHMAYALLVAAAERVKESWPRTALGDEKDEDEDEDDGDGSSAS